MKQLSDYTLKREESTPLRVFNSDKKRFDELKRRLVLASEGLRFSQGQVMNWLLDLAEETEAFLEQRRPK